MIARAIHLVAGQTQVFLSALVVPYDHLLLCSTVEFSGVTLNLLEVRADGRMSYERKMGKKATTVYSQGLL